MLSKLHSFVCFQTHFICINDALIFITLVCSCFFIIHSLTNFRALDFHRNLQITDKTILDKQIVHETLYKLWKDEYIDSEVCSINSTHVAFLASTNFFVYSHLFNNTFVPLLWSCCFKIVIS